MRIIRLDLDGSLPRQGLDDGVDMRTWGPRIRIASSFARFRKFESELGDRLGRRTKPELVFFGSGDFHHVSLALLRRINIDCNFVIFDLHPDWMRGIPFLHCGTWLSHALRLPHVHTIFHVGGAMDFDNAYRWLAPWSDLRKQRLILSPALHPFQRGRWKAIQQQPARNIKELLFGHRDELSRRPLYISLDKDVLTSADAIVNWESGHLRLDSVLNIIREFISAADGKLAGMDVTGDWSPVEVEGFFRRWLDWTEHPKLNIDPDVATECNRQTNKVIVEWIRSLIGADQ